MYAAVLKWDESQHPRDKDGQFARVMMTSQRAEGDPGHQENRDVFKAMREFEGKLKALPGVSRAVVKPGVGGWEGGREAMWQIYYRGNGEATKLIAATAKRYNQDSVLMLKGCTGENCQPVVELSFAHGVSGEARKVVEDILVANGIGGWTWMKKHDHTELRMVYVPQWSERSAEAHRQATIRVSQLLRERGLGNKRHVKKAAVHILEREGAHSYDQALR